MRWFDALDGSLLGQIQPVDAELVHLETWTVRWHSHDGSVFGYYTRDGQLALVDCDKRITRRIGSVGSPVLVNQKSETGVFRSYLPSPFYQFVLEHQYHRDSRKMEAKVLHQATGRRIRHHLRPWKEYGTLSPDGRLMATVYNEDLREVHLYETATGMDCGKIIVPGWAESFAFSPDGRTLATCNNTTILIWDMHRNWSGTTLASPCSEEEADRLWQILGEVDPLIAHPALWALVGGSEQALPMLKKRLAPVQAHAPTWLQRQIANLDHASYGERTLAADVLRRLGEQAVPSLQAALKHGPNSLEQKRRIEELLLQIDRIPAVPPHLRELRAIEVLERIGTAEARTILESVASGDPASSVTFEAQLALTRMKNER